MKKLLFLSILAVSLAFLAGKVKATSEVAIPDGGLGLSSLGVVRNSTSSAQREQPSQETRNIRVQNDGRLDVVFGVSKTTYMPVTFQSSTFTNVRDSVDSSTSNAINRNVLATATITRPVLLKRVRPGKSNVDSISNAYVRIYDTRGSTDIAGNVYPVFEDVIGSTLSANGYRDLDIYISSGLTVWKQGSGIVNIDWSEFGR